MIKILIADDDNFILDYIARILKKADYEVLTARHGEEALEVFTREQPTLVLLDVMMPRLNGFEVCEKIRAQAPLVPILILTAKNQIPDKVQGLRVGADDYITKPFERQEFLARIETALRRVRHQVPAQAPTVPSVKSPLKIGDLVIDSKTWTASYKETLLKLSKTEFNLLKLFCENADKLLDRETLLKDVWGYDYVGHTRTVDNFVMRVRKKLQEALAEFGDLYPQLETIYGVGYCLKTKEAQKK